LMEMVKRLSITRPRRGVNAGCRGAAGKLPSLPAPARRLPFRPARVAFPRGFDNLKIDQAPRSRGVFLSWRDMPQTFRVDVPDLAATTAFGHRLSALLFPGAVVALMGQLGAGKTQLVRAVAERLGIADCRVVSIPTLVLILCY